jgi:hypothetical protein
MTKRSKILKVISILMIIFGAILICACLAGFFGLRALDAHLDAAIISLLTGFGKFFLLRLAITSAVSLAAGIAGLCVPKKKPLKVLGIIALILTGITCVTMLIIPFVWGFIALPILYLVGVKRCK